MKAQSIVMWLLITSGASAWPAATPPPTNVRASEITAVDALTGSFVLEWSPRSHPTASPTPGT